MMPFYESPDKSITSFVNNKEEYILIKMEGDINEEEYKEVFMLLLDPEKTQGYNKVLFNQENVGNVSSKSRAWLVLKFMPMLQKQLGTNFEVAVIKSSTTFQRIAAQVLLKSLMAINNKFRIAYFEERAVAKEWLVSKKK
ncbi:STAS/SEC14 domain-containing protein [Bernardetia sp. Wsw4-3y2]|uniref:STAS/SEC14 domain-containing protein n=1 Tax=unclassified Bernardetia TaxID=2647129 RepID=UPI0030D3F016